MSADKILRTQDHSSNVVKSAGKFEDVFKQNNHERVAVIRNSAVRRREIAMPQPWGFNKTISARVPQVDYLGDMYLVVKTNALEGSNASFRAKWASQMVASFRLRNAGKLIQEHTNSPACFNYMYDRLSDEKKTQLDKLLGASGAAAQTVIIPVPAFWCSWMCPNLEKKSPLHYGKLSGNEGLVLEWTTNAIDRCCGVNPSNDPISSASLVFFEMLTEADLMDQHKKESYVFQGNDYKVRANIDLAANTEKAVDITALTGANKLYYINCVSDTDAGNEAYTNRTACSALQLEVDGREYQRVSTSEEIQADALLWGGVGSNSGSSNNMILMGVDAKSGHRGHLNTRDCKDARLRITCGVAATADIVAVQDVCWKIQNGSLYRYE